jgi:hypothetical protein
LRGAEKDLIKFAREGDRHIRLEDKMFVFFGRMDSFATREAFQRDFQHAVQAWREEANLPSTRIIGGSAGAHLVLHGMAESETLKDLGDQQKIAADLRRVTGENTAELDVLKTLTGIDAIKTTINHYLNHERVAIVERRCTALFETILRHSEDIYRQVRGHFPEDPDEARRRQDEDRNLAFNQWWSARQDQLKAEFNAYYNKEVSADFNANTLRGFNQRYEEIVRENMAKLPARAAAQRDYKFFSSMQHGFDPDAANREWREALYKDVRQMIQEIAAKLAVELDQDTQKISEFVTGQLWGSDRVRHLLVGDTRQFQERLQYSLKALFLRFVRPLAEALVRAPVNSQTRMNIVRDSGVDIEILDYYYPESGEILYRELKQYLRHGSKLLTDPAVAKNMFSSQSDKIDKIRETLKNAVAGVSEQGVDQENRRQVVEEVEADLLALEYYLLHSLFDAAGFKAFCQQELENLRDRYLERMNDGSWGGIAGNEWRNGNSIMVAELPPELRPQTFNTEVSDRLRQLGIAIQQARHSV